MIPLLTIHLTQLRHCLLGVVRDRRRHGDTGAMNTLEMVVLVLGGLALAGIFVAVMREAVTSRTAQIK